MSIDTFRAVLVSHPEVLFYLYSGKYDQVVPVESFAPELKAISELPNVHYTGFTSSGHDGYRTEPKIWLDLIRESALLH